MSLLVCAQAMLVDLIGDRIIISLFKYVTGEGASRVTAPSGQRMMQIWIDHYAPIHCEAGHGVAALGDLGACGDRGYWPAHNECGQAMTVNAVL